EIRRFLGERAGFQRVPRVVGSIEYRRAREEAITLGILHHYIPNRGTAWEHTLKALAGYFERVRKRGGEIPAAPAAGSPAGAGPPAGGPGGRAGRPRAAGRGVGPLPCHPRRPDRGGADPHPR